MSELLNQVHASNPIGQMKVFTMELAHDSTFGKLCLVQGYYDFEATTEAGVAVTYGPAAMGLQYPERGVSGQQDLLFAFDNINRVVWPLTRQVQRSIRRSPEQVTATMRVYLDSDRSAPIERPISAPVLDFVSNPQQIQFRASFHDFFAKGWPSRTYDQQIFKGLRYIN